MQRAQQIELWRKSRVEKSQEGAESPVEESRPVRPVMNRKLPHFRYVTESKVLNSVDRRGKETVATEKTGLVDERIISKIVRDHNDLTVIDIWGEIYLTTPTRDEGGQLLRAHPAFDRFGAMFDWVAATFETAESNDDSDGDSDDDGVVGPAKLLAFYKDGDGVERAVVHATNMTTGRETKASNTRLVQNVKLEFLPNGHPGLRTIRVDQIEEGIMAFEHEKFDGPLPPAIDYSTEKSKFVVSCFDNRQNWAYLFYEWANDLPVTEVPTTKPESDDDTDNESDSADDTT